MRRTGSISITHTLQAPDQRTADFTKVRNKETLWLIDRKVQRTETSAGIEGFTLQDHAIQESMGPIVDRAEEHLGSSDKAVVAARLLLLKAVRTVQPGADPLVFSPPIIASGRLKKYCHKGLLEGFTKSRDFCR